VHKYLWFLGLCLPLISFNSFAIDTVQVDALVSGDGASGDLLGWSVDVDGDTAIVGANHDDGLNGGVYIFVRTPGTNSWSQQAKLQETTGAGQFGFSVAIDGDTVVVGAYLKGGTTGEAYVHTRTGTIWSAGTPLASRTGNACQFCQQFGRSVAVSGTTIVIGSMFDGGSLNGQAAGVAYVFESNGSGGWVPGDTTTRVNGKAGTLEEGMLIASLPGSVGLINPDGAAYDAFGSAVAIDGNIIIVGAENADSTDGISLFEKGNGTVQGNGTGAAYLFERSGLEWVVREKVKPGLPEGSTSKFGHSVDIDGNRAVVGAFVEGTGTSAPGAVYSFVQGSPWFLSKKLEPTTNTAGFAGTSVAINGTSVLVGAPGTNTAYLYGDVTTEAPASELNAGGTINFGQSVAISLDSDSRPSFLVGAPSPGVGSAFIFLDVVVFADGGE